jgi:hypothetical protein
VPIDIHVHDAAGAQLLGAIDAVLFEDIEGTGWKTGYGFLDFIRS